jgi:undecaprenyl-diphosphatase
MVSRVRRWLTERIKWLRAPELGVGVILVVIGVLVTGFLFLGSEVAEGDTGAFDRTILLAFRHTPDDPLGPPWFEAAVMHISALGSAAVTFLVTAIAAAYFALAGMKRYAVLVVAAAAGTELWMWLLKSLYGRTRPDVVTHLDPLESLSFPSGHSTIAAALYMTLAVLIARALKTRRLRIFVVVTGAALALLIGTSRVYLGVHYPTDVVGGWTLGLAWALTCGLIARHLGSRGKVEPPGAAADTAA